MSYAQSAGRANPAAMIGALGVPAAFGAILITGLAVVQVIKEEKDNPIVVPITPDPITDPPVEPKTDPSEAVREETVTITPPTTPDTDFTLSNSDPITTLPSTDEFVIGPVEIVSTGGAGTAVPLDIPALPDPISASPRNNPGGWVSEGDYRSDWIRREWTGVAGFAVTIDKNGKVSDCTITRSTGHSQMDAATCRLIERRARFNPAKDSYGNPVTGTYSNSVNWRLPE